MRAGVIALFVAVTGQLPPFFAATTSGSGRGSASGFARNCSALLLLGGLWLCY